MTTEFDCFTIDQNTRAEVWCKGDTGATYVVMTKAIKEPGWILAGHILVHFSTGSPELSGVMAIQKEVCGELTIESISDALFKSLGVSPKSSRMLGFFYESGQMFSVMKGQRHLIH